MTDRSARDRQEATFRCTACGTRLGGLETAKGGEPATGAAIGRFLRFEDGKVFARCRCGSDTHLPLEVRVIFPPASGTGLTASPDGTYSQGNHAQG